MIIRNGYVFGADGFQECDLEIDGGIITDIADCGDLDGDGFDAGGAYVLPGFVDIHTHGCVNSDICDADAGGIERMLAYYGRQGVTSVVMTTMSYDEETLQGIIRAARPYIGKSGYGAVLRGLSLEGPFINKSKSGAQNPEYIVDPDVGLFDRLYDAADGGIRLFNIAPELPGSMDLIHHAAKRCTVSLAHTNADYDCAALAFAEGASHVTHLFNAMSSFNHREPGLIGAAFDGTAHVEIISDGVHLHPSVVRAMFGMFGKHRVCLVSDSTRGSGMPNGEYDLGGQATIIRDGRSNLADGGAIAGSAMNLTQCFRKAVEFGVPFSDAVLAASHNPARAVSISSVTGSLRIGKCADVLVLGANLEVLAVFVGGERIA
ncbi:MAG: N-acetylglucosamine-6-phosphate deacetylase [Oscillospiraceae bacterium]|nr:N-acetylglucosamine-6-phosphate deacetylase [Oscillospiraceae bacterium]